VLTVEGEPTELQKVARCAEISGGTINVLNPLEMIRQLRLISQNYVVATAVSITLQLHNEMEIDDTSYPKVPSLHIETQPKIKIILCGSAHLELYFIDPSKLEIFLKQKHHHLKLK